MFDGCKDCAERREKIKAHMKAIAEWIKNPSGSAIPLIGNMQPPTPQIRGRQKDPGDSKSE